MRLRGGAAQSGRRDRVMKASSQAGTARKRGTGTAGEAVMWLPIKVCSLPVLSSWDNGVVTVQEDVFISSSHTLTYLV